MMVHRISRRRSFQRCAVLLLVLLSLAPRSYASNIPRIWRDLYKELNNGENPSWKSREEAESWAASEGARLEPLVLDMLQGKRSEAGWPTAAYLARTVSSTAVREKLLDRVREVSQKANDVPLDPSAPEAFGLVHALAALASVEDIRIRPIALELIAVNGQAYQVVEQSIRALQKVGGLESLDSLRAISLRQRDVFIDRLCGLTEKLIEARGRGNDLLENAQKELKTLAVAYLTAVETKEYRAYRNVMPFRFPDDEAEVRREVFEEHALTELFSALKEALNGTVEFVIDRDNLTAHWVFAGRWKLECVLEVDGWKVSGITRVAP